jgi:hypothetical protein
MTIARCTKDLKEIEKYYRRLAKETKPTDTSVGVGETSEKHRWCNWKCNVL